MIINSRADSGEPFVAAYIAEDSSQAQIDSTYERNQFYYRRLREGEISLASPGIAEQHMARGGTVSHRAGPLTQVMSVERLEIVSKAPTVITRALDHTLNEISSEIRFGVAKRVNTRDSTQDKFIKVTPEGTATPVFAKEYLRNVQSKASPFTLVDHREGHVIDDSGEEATSSVTGKKLRSRTKWGTANARDALAEVDVNGNINVKIPSGASYGLNVEVEETDAKIILGRDELHNVGRNLLFDVTQSATVTAQSISLEASTTIEMDATTQMSGTSPIIQFMADTTFSAISTGAAILGGASVALASSSISMGPGADSPGGAPGAQGMLKQEPFSPGLTALASLVATQSVTVTGLSGTPLAGLAPIFTAIINYISGPTPGSFSGLQAAFESSATTSVKAV